MPRTVQASGSATRAFTLIELLIVISIIALLVAILLPSLKGARKAARLTVCMSGERQLGIAQNNYANQYKELIGTFNRKPGAGTTWLGEAGLQAQEIVQRIRGTPIGYTPNRYFHRNYWHLPAVSDGAFGSDPNSLISPVVACPEDAVVLEWKKNVYNPTALLIGMASDGAVNYEQYRPYWSSYQQAPCSWSPDKSVAPGTTVGQITTYHHLFTGGGTSPGQMALGTRRLSEVAFPSAKVWMFDLYDRHYFKRMIWHGYLEARQPLLFFDGSVRTFQTRDSRDGIVSPELTAAGNATDINAAGPKTYTYNPATGWLQYDPPVLNGSSTVYGKYRWTFKGLKGWDYLGKQSSTGN
jgi:prepilin-type N-terminal cleavage/methylation domain-containing protein